jgi:xanthine/uracil permease
MDLQTLAMVIGAVMIVAALMYVLDRRAKKVAVDYTDLGKLVAGAGLVTGGVVYAIGTDVIETAVDTVASTTQEMFVGKPEF